MNNEHTWKKLGLLDPGVRDIFEKKGARGVKRSSKEMEENPNGEGKYMENPKYSKFNFFLRI